MGSYCMSIKGRRGYWKLKDEALHRTMVRTRFGKGRGPGGGGDDDIKLEAGKADTCSRNSA